MAWADKFRYEQTAAAVVPQSWIARSFPPDKPAARARQIDRRHDAGRGARPALGPTARSGGRLLPGCLTLFGMGLSLSRLPTSASALLRFAGTELSWGDLLDAIGNGGITLLRVAILIVIATAIWVPIGVVVGLRPALAEKVQPLAQFLAAFPANLFFPLAVYLIVRFQLSPIIWLSPLMILGTQWYILFNVIAGASAFPTDFEEAATTFRIRGWRWWRDVMLPGIFPYYVTGAITASGGAWNASIVSEWVSWGPTKLNGSGLGAYIAQMTEAGDYPRIALGIAVMSVLVVGMNRLLWRPLYAYAERRTRLD